jgi:hypothetical protein
MFKVNDILKLTSWKVYKLKWACDDIKKIEQHSNENVPKRSLILFFDQSNLKILKKFISFPNFKVGRLIYNFAKGS